jgi:hypothetical protein
MNADDKWFEPYSPYKVPDDRLERWMILGGPGTPWAPKSVVAENIRTEAVAKLLASAPAMRDKLAKIQALVDAAPNISALASPAFVAAISAILSAP